MQRLSLLIIITVGFALESHTSDNGVETDVRILQSYSQHIISSEVYRFVLNVSIGNPPQWLMLAPSFLNSDLWLTNGECNTEANGDSCEGTTSLEGIRQFNYSKSGTCEVDKKTKVDLAYAHGSATGYRAKDQIRLGGMNLGMADFALIDHVDSSQWSSLEFDGIIGLCWPSVARKGLSPPLSLILDKLDDKIFTVHLKKPQTEYLHGLQKNVPEGTFTFGAKNYRNCGSDWKYVPLFKPEYWEFTLDAFSIGNFTVESKGQSTSIHNSAWIDIDKKLFKPIMEKLNGREIEGHNGTNMTVCCDCVDDLPDFVFTINGEEYRVPPEDYTRKILVGGEVVCQVAVRVKDKDGTAEFAWALGDPFMRNYCTLFDMGRQQIGFAKSINHSSR